MKSFEEILAETWLKPVLRTAEVNPTHLRSEHILYPLNNKNREGESTCQDAHHDQTLVISVDKERRNNTDYRGPSSAGGIFDVLFRQEPYHSKNSEATPKIRCLECDREPTAGGTALTEEKGEAEQNRDSSLTRNHRPKKRKQSPTFDNGPGDKRSRSSRPAALSVSRGPPPVNDNNQYAVECLRERRNRGHVIEYLVKWEGYGEADNSWVKEADIHPSLIEDFASTVV